MPFLSCRDEKIGREGRELWVSRGDFPAFGGFIFLLNTLAEYIGKTNMAFAKQRLMKT